MAATRAFDMLEAIGARTSMREGAAGDAYSDVDLVEQTLSDLRIKHIRETQTLASFNNTQHVRQRDAFIRLNTNLGVRVQGPVGKPGDTEGTVQDFATQTKTVYGGFAGGIIEGAENGNEWNGRNGPGDTPTVVNPCGDGKDYKQWAWQLRVRAKEIDLYFRQDAALVGVAAVGPSLVGGPGITKYQDLGDVSQWVDRGNYHYYTDTDPVPTYLVPNYAAAMTTCFGTAPVWCTETGLNNAVNMPSTGLQWHPEDVTAVYMPRLLLEHKWFGNARTYQFELLDDHVNTALDSPEEHWGVVRFDGTQKPVYATWKTMADTIYDSGVTAATFTPTPLQMTLTGPSDMRYLLFQKSNGHYVLAMWRNVSIWTRPSTYLTVTPSNAVLTLAGVTPLTIRNGLTSSTTSTTSNTTTVALAGDMALINIGGS